jgi:hypothetical protein
MALTSNREKAGRPIPLSVAIGWAAVLAFALCIAHLAFLPLANGDMYWQVRAGEILLAQRRFLDHDIFSYTVAGAPWNNHEWLFELFLALLYRAFGWLGLRLWVLATIGGAFVYVAVYVARRANLWMALGLVCAWLGLVWYKFIPAAQTTSMVLFLLGYWAFLRPDLWVTRRKLALFGFLLVWGNLSAEVVVFLPFLVVDQVFRYLRRQTPELPSVRRWLWLGFALVVPTLNPPGASVAEYVLDGTLINRAVNTEFAHLWETTLSLHPSIKALAWLVIAAWLIATFATLATNVRSTPRLVLLHRSAAPALAIVAAMLFERNLWMLLLPMVQMALALHRWLAHRARPLLVHLLPAVAALGFFVFFQHSLPWWGPQLAFRDLGRPSFYTVHLSADDLPIACDGAMEAIPPEHRMLTSRLWGNWLIWRFPNRPVFIDGRNREFPPILHQLNETVVHGRPGAQAILDAFRVDAVLTQPGWLKKPGIAREQWQRVFATRVCALYRRQSPSPARDAAAGSAMP